jgi:hypothetical protein
VTRADKTGQLNVDGTVDPITLPGSERALYTPKIRFLKSSKIVALGAPFPWEVCFQ